MVSYSILAVTVSLTGAVSLILGYRLASSSADLLITWLKEQVLAYQERWQHAEQELAEERARQGKGDE
jgi:hypothetical protein